MNLVMIGGFIANGWMTICTSLSYLVYNLVELLYRVFASISNVNLFSKSVFDKFTARMYSVVAILMLFILAYNLILMIINPDDKKGTGQTTKFVKEVVISLILIILLPLVFNYMAIFQKHILDSQIITKIVLGGSTGDANSDCDFSKYTSLDKLDSENISTATLKRKCEKYNGLTPSVQGAYIMNATMVGSFLYPINYNFNKCEDFIIKCDGTDLKNCDKDSKISDKKDRELCGKYFYNYKMTQYDGGIWHLLNNSYFKNMVKDEDQKILNFNYFLALVGGILALIMFASYTIMIGIRVAKLGFLELISPIPVMMRMIPKQKEAFFDKWLKELKNTYLDVFIRLIIINFALFSISLVPDVIEQLSASGDDSLAVVLLAKFVVILGILQFAKETPDLIKEFFGGSGRFSIKKGFENWKSAGKTMSGVAGMGATGVNRLANLGHNFARIAKNEEMSKKDKAIAMLKNSGRMLNPLAMASAMKNGYDNTKDGKDFLKGVNDATTKSLTQKGLFYQARRNAEDAFEQFGRLATTDFTTQDTKKLKGIIATTDDFTKKQKGLFSDIDDHKHVKAINNYYDRQIEEANKRGDFNAATQLGKDRKAAVEKMRQAVMEEMLKGHEAKVTLRSNGTFAISNDMRNINNDLIKSSASTALENINKIVNENPDLLKKALENNSLVMDADGKFSQTKFDDLVSNLKSGNTATLDKVGKAMTNLNKTANNTIIEIEQKNSGNK